MINTVVTDLVDNTRAVLDKAHPTDIEDVRLKSKALVGMSRSMEKRHQALKKFLRKSLYQHERVLTMTETARRVVTGLFDCYMNDVRAMPHEHANKASSMESESGDAGRARAVADYVAGMTDRYALSAYQRLVDADTTL